MPRTTQRPTPELTTEITNSIANGGFAHVAAEAAGVPRATFAAWIAKGTKHGAREPFRSFVLAVNKAKAQARLAAECRAMEEDPKFWLRAGPGREKGDDPGWTAALRPLLTTDRAELNLFSSPEFLAFMATLRNVLASYPDALAAVSDAMAGKPAPKNITDQAEIEK